MIISYNSSYEEVEEFILNHNNSLVCNDLGELFLLKDYLWLVSQQTQHKYLLSEVLYECDHLTEFTLEVGDEVYVNLVKSLPTGSIVASGNHTFVKNSEDTFIFVMPETYTVVGSTTTIMHSDILTGPLTVLSLPEGV